MLPSVNCGLGDLVFGLSKSDIMLFAVLLVFILLRAGKPGVARATAAVEPEATEAGAPPGGIKLEVEVPADADRPTEVPPDKLDTPNPRFGELPVAVLPASADRMYSMLARRA